MNTQVDDGAVHLYNGVDGPACGADDGECERDRALVTCGNCLVTLHRAARRERPALQVVADPSPAEAGDIRALAAAKRHPLWPKPVTQPWSGRMAHLAMRPEESQGFGATYTPDWPAAVCGGITAGRDEPRTSENIMCVECEACLLIVMLFDENEADSAQAGRRLVACRLTAWRNERKLTQIALSLACGFSTSVVSGWEVNGTGKPDKLDKMLHALGRTHAELNAIVLEPREMIQ